MPHIQCSKNVLSIWNLKVLLEFTQNVDIQVHLQIIKILEFWCLYVNKSNEGCEGENIQFSLDTFYFASTTLWCPLNFKLLSIFKLSKNSISSK